MNPPFDVETARRLLAAALPPWKVAEHLRIDYPMSGPSNVAPLLEPAVRHVAQKYVGLVEFDFVGWVPDNPAGPPGVCLHPQIVDSGHYLRFKISHGWDIGLAPLHHGLFEGCKINNKYREYGRCRVAALRSRVSPFPRMRRSETERFRCREHR